MRRPIRPDLVDACVLEVVGLVADQRWLADRALERVLRRERRLYAGERRAVAEAAYGMLRTQGQLAWLARGSGSDSDSGVSGAEPPKSGGLGGGASEVNDGEAAAPLARRAKAPRAQPPAKPATRSAPEALPPLNLDPATLYALWLARSGAATPAVAASRLGVQAGLVAAALDGADERIAAIADPMERLAVEASLPRWIVRRFTAELGEDAARALARAMGERAPLTIRANLLRTDRAALQQRLGEEGAPARPTLHSPWGLVLEGHANAFALPSFQDGLFEIQDEGSQLAALAVGARPGQIVADCCAGAGGKSLALAAEMRGKGSLHALDADPGRLDEARRRARRAGVHNLRARPIPAGAEADAALADLAGRCDRVLVDAPCSGLGTLRRRPDARWRLRAGDPERFAAIQRELVARFARLVRPGGRLVYATCAIGRLENEDVAAFIERELPGLTPLPLAEGLGADLARDLGARGHMLQLLPHVHGTDGFFLAAFRREK